MSSLQRKTTRLDTDAIRDRYAHADPASVEAFWERVRRLGTPLREPGQDRATFLWRAPHAAERPGGAASVHLHVNRLTDKEHYDRGRMHHVPGTDIWALTLPLPRGTRASYGFTPLAPGERPPGGLPRLGHYATRRDPLNPLPALIDHGDRGLAVVCAEHAPPQPEWETDAAHEPPRGTVFRRTLPLDPARGPDDVLGRPRPHWLYLPPDTGGELPLLTLFDAETWFGDLPLPRALEAAADAGRLPPVAVLGIANRERLDRIACLGANADFLRGVAAGATEWAEKTAAAAGRRLAGASRRVIAGQSLGGLSALLAALELPDSYGAALAHSASLWWTPDGKSSPRDLGGRPGGDWITERFAAAGPRAVRLRLDVGRHEARTVPHTRTLHRTLLDRGWTAELTEYTGGHDYAWWRGALIDDLAAVLGPSR